MGSISFANYQTLKLFPSFNSFLHPKPPGIVSLYHHSHKVVLPLSLPPRGALFPVLLDSSPTLFPNGNYTVADFMTRKEDLHVVKTTTSVDEALEALVEKRVNGFPVTDDEWKLTFNEIQKLMSKNNGKAVGDLMTPSPLVICETTNLEDAAGLLLKTKYR